MHLNDSQGCAQRVDAAIRLAGRHSAYLTGVYPIVEIPLLNYIREQIPEDIQARMEAEAQRPVRPKTAGHVASPACGSLPRPARGQNITAPSSLT